MIRRIEENRLVPHAELADVRRRDLRHVSGSGRELQPNTQGNEDKIIRHMWRRIKAEQGVEYEADACFDSSGDSSIWEFNESDPDSEDESLEEERNEAQEAGLNGLDEVARFEMYRRMVVKENCIYVGCTLLLKERFGTSTFDDTALEAMNEKEKIKSAAVAAAGQNADIKDTDASSEGVLESDLVGTEEKMIEAAKEVSMRENVEETFLEANRSNLDEIEQKVQTLDVANALPGGINELEDAKIAQNDLDQVESKTFRTPAKDEFKEGLNEYTTPADEVEFQTPANDSLETPAVDERQNKGLKPVAMESFVKFFFLVFHLFFLCVLCLFNACLMFVSCLFRVCFMFVWRCIWCFLFVKTFLSVNVSARVHLFFRNVRKEKSSINIEW